MRDMGWGREEELRCRSTTGRGSRAKEALLAVRLFRFQLAINWPVWLPWKTKFVITQIN